MSSFFQNDCFSKTTVFIKFVVSLTIIYDTLLTILNDNPPFTIVNDHPLLTIVNIFINEKQISQTIVFFKTTVFLNNRLKHDR